MSWKPPTTESAWEECLSAYADGELDADTKAALEVHLQQDAKRAQQLDAIRKATAVLQSWTVNPPRMDPAFRESLNQREMQSGVSQARSRWRGALRLAAVFAMGVVAGMLMMNGTRPMTIESPVARVEEKLPEAREPVITPSQADAVFLEVEAAALSRRIELDAKESRWKKAKAGIEQMRTNYADTNAATAFANGPTARRVLRFALRRSS